jgi:trans-aconitate 2-methyltransferase
LTRPFDATTIRPPMPDVASYYDDYADRQLRIGINARHHAIAAGLREAGWHHGDRVLEVGAGIGTLTGLLAEELGPGGSLLAVDLSPHSIELARERLHSHANIELLAADVLELELERKFDVIVLPDVIEHIPLDLHDRLFGRLTGWLTDDGFIFLNYPNPLYLAWCHEHTPEVLQIIDQPVHADVLVSNAYRHGLYLDRLETYSLWVREGDYVRAVLRRCAGQQSFTRLSEPQPSLCGRLVGRVRRSVRG